VIYPRANSNEFLRRLYSRFRFRKGPIPGNNNIISITMNLSLHIRCRECKSLQFAESQHYNKCHLVPNPLLLRIHMGRDNRLESPMSLNREVLSNSNPIFNPPLRPMFLQTEIHNSVMTNLISDSQRHGIQVNPWSLRWDIIGLLQVGLWVSTPMLLVLVMVNWDLKGRDLHRFLQMVLLRGPLCTFSSFTKLRYRFTK